MSKTKREKLVEQLRAKADNLKKSDEEKEKKIQHYKTKLKTIQRDCCNPCSKKIQKIMES